MPLDAFTIRLPSEAKAGLSQQAEAAGRSLSAEIVSRLRVHQPDTIPAPTNPAQHESIAAVEGQEPKGA